MNVLSFYLNTLICGNVGQRCSYQFKVDSYHCSHEATIEIETEEHEIQCVVSPILSMAQNGGKLLASANEAGLVKLSDISDLNTISCFELHQNAIFDIKWRPKEPSQLLAASGDLSISLVDVEFPEKKIAHIADSHSGSVRSINFKDSNVFASGSRDGQIKIWDLRDTTKAMISIPSAHDVNSKFVKRKLRKHKTRPTNVVTSVLFNDYSLYSGGSSDGLIKLWDTRKKGNNKRQPVHEIPYNGCSNFSDRQGYTCLLMSKGLLYASCSDKIVYCYSSQLDTMIGRYRGARINNYTKLSIVQDEYLVCGSMNKCACVWKLNDKPQPKGSVVSPSFILPEEHEVASVETISEIGCIFTGSDAGRLRKWSFDYFDEKVIKERAVPFEDYQETTLNESEIENIPNNSIENISSDNLNDSLTRNAPLAENQPTPRIIKSLKPRKRKSPRSYSPKTKKSAKTRHQPTEPLTPITNYYQKLPKENTPKG